MNAKEKQWQLEEDIKRMSSLCVAFSAGVDSTFLLASAKKALGDKAIAVTVRSSMYMKREHKEAVAFTKKMGIKHIMLDADEYSIKEFVENGKERCYYCKYAIFSKIKEVAKKYGIEYVADGSNLDDDNDFRPGMRAIKELRVESPLKKVGLSKQEIRDLSKEMGLFTWDKPAFACLASRIPYGMPITREKLEMVEKAEEYLMDLGFKQFRVRHHGELARIEVLPDERRKFFDEQTLDDITRAYKEIGFKYVTMDLEGYRMGSLNV